MGSFGAAELVLLLVMPFVILVITLSIRQTSWTKQDLKAKE